MDPLFNRLFIPSATTGVTHIIKPSGKTFITGLASSYDNTSYDKNFFESFNISEREYLHILESINELIFNYWPCTLCQLIGYCFCPCTCGLSFLCPGLSVSDAKSRLLIEIEEINTQTLRPKGLIMMLRIQYSTSWLEIHDIKKYGKKNSTKFSSSCTIEM
jgi:hypothetical protein